MNYFWNAVSSGSNSLELLLFLAASAMKATFLLGFVALLCLALRRFSAATRHLLWTLSLCAALLLPFLSAVEVWEVPVLPAQISNWNQAQPNEPARTTDDAPFILQRAEPQGTKAAPAIGESELRSADFQPVPNAFEKPFALTNPSRVEALPQQRSAPFLSTLVNWALAIWFAGAVLLLLRLVVGFMATKLLKRGAVEFRDPKLNGLFASLLDELQLTGKVRLLRSHRTLMPVVCGVWRAVVLLPASADDWPEERSRMVLLHELTHVTRRDCLTQMLGQAACAFYWFNPFVWHAARRLRVEREQACDDYVLSIGTKPSDYAHHLLEIARYIQEQPVFQWSETTTVAMARHSQLEGRLLSILSKDGKRRAMPQVMTACVTALMFLLFSSLAILRPTVSSAQDTQAFETVANETHAAAKSPSGQFSTTVSELKAGAMIRGAGQQASSVTQANNVKADDSSQEKVLNSEQVNEDVKQVLKTNIVPVIKNELAGNTAPQLEHLPVPAMLIEGGSVINPFIKASYRQERKAVAEADAEDFIDEMASVGYTNLPVQELVHLKVSGVTAVYVKSLRALGLNNLTTKELAGMSINDVTPTFIEAIRSGGYKELTAKELMAFRIHGITPEFIDRLRKAGYGELSARQLIEFAVQRVTPEFINSMRAVGFPNLSARELVTLRVHAVTPEFVREAQKRLGALTIKQIIALKLDGLIDGSGDE